MYTGFYRGFFFSIFQHHIIAVYQAIGWYNQYILFFLDNDITLQLCTVPQVSRLVNKSSFYYKSLLVAIKLWIYFSDSRFKHLVFIAV